ncbi:hypothetical protein B5S32_g4963 [[Candida] boidinii]|nr:hypothetical protein B5S32_g4963 [[Candida] boidinii]
MISSSSGRGRAKIRPPKKIALSEIDFQKSWSVIEGAISEIQNKNASKLSFEDLYRRAYNLVLRKNGRMLYENVESVIRNHLENHIRTRLLIYVDTEETVKESLSSTVSSTASGQGLSGSVGYDHDEDEGMETEVTHSSTVTSNDNNKNTNLEYNQKQFLQLLNKEWEDHLLSMRMISDVLMYLDRVYAKEFHLPLVYDIGLNAFRDRVIKYNNNEIGEKVIDIIIGYINKSRHGVIIDKFILKAIIFMFESLPETFTLDNHGSLNNNNNNNNNGNGGNGNGENYYLKYFEPKLMNSSDEYFSKISNDLLKEKSGTLYINNVMQLIKDEEVRMSLILPEITCPKLVELIDKDLITRNMEHIMKLDNDGLKTWINEDNIKILSSLYALISRVDSEHEMLKRQLRILILSTGEELEQSAKSASAAAATAATAVAQSGKESSNDTPPPGEKEKSKKKVSSKESLTQNSIKRIKDILQMKVKYDNVIKRAFNNNPGIIRTTESAFSEFINKNNRISEYLSLFIDDGIKKSFKDKTPEECEDILDKAIVVFRFIKDKDIFEKYYKNHLAKRLLQQKSLSNDYEMSMITKLKNEIGSSFTAKFEGMFKDIKLSQDFSSEFCKNVLSKDEEAKQINNGRKLEIETSVLTGNFWPMPNNKVIAINYPPELAFLKEKFESYYISKHHGRNLTWGPNFGAVDIRMHYPKKTYEVNMPTYAAVIILSLFRDDDEDCKEEYTFNEIYDITNIPKPELVRHLQSISVAAKTRLLKKTPMSRDINPEDKFSINDKFHSSATKIKVLTVSSTNKVEDDKERHATLEVVERSRVLEAQAAIVRIMKARRTLAHNELLTEVIKQLSNRFKPSPMFIKQRIEDLIEKEYLMRDEEERNIYHYLA